MYKEIIICIIIVCLIVCLNVITQRYTKESVEYMDEKLQFLKESMLIEENEKITDMVQGVLDNWKERKDKLEYFIEHDELEKVETELTSLKANIDVEEYKEGLIDLEKARFILKHIREKYTIKIQNIF